MPPATTGTPFGSPPSAGASSAIGSAATRVLRVLTDTDAPLHVASVAAALGGHPNTARAHLEALVERALVTRTASTTGKRGRPRLAYAPTARGYLAVAPTGLEQLVQAFAQRVSEALEPRAEALAVGRIWGSLLARKAGSKGQLSDEVLALLDYAGFSPRRDSDATGLSVALRTCPLLDAARAHSQVVCEVHRAMVSAALTAYGQPSAVVALQPFAEIGACRLRVTFPDGDG